MSGAVSVHGLRYEIGWCVRTCRKGGHLLLVSFQATAFQFLKKTKLAVCVCHPYKYIMADTDFLKGIDFSAAAAAAARASTALRSPCRLQFGKQKRECACSRSRGE